MKEIFLSSRCGPFTYIQNVVPIGGTVFYPVIPFINVTEIWTLRSSSLNARIPGALLLSVFSLRLAGKVKSSNIGQQRFAYSPYFALASFNILSFTQ